MPNEFISQDEVDSLLKGVVDEPESAPVPEETGGVRTYKLGTEQRIVQDRMPALEVINDRFARRLRIGLFNFMRRSPEISIAPPRVVEFGEFSRNLVVPTNLNLATVKPLRGTTMFVFEPALVFRIIDNLFGGDGRFQTRVEGREVTRTELQIIQRLLHVVFEDYQHSWENVYPLRFEYVRSEMHTQFANIATPTEIVVVSTFNIGFGGQGGAFHICIPYSTLEPIRALIHHPVRGDQAEPDRRWMHMLQKQVQAADVEIVADLTTTTMKLGGLMTMKVGDVLPIDLPSTIEAKVDGVPVIACGYGELNGRYALRVERVLSPERETKPGEAHA
jgi:flagellar motor switch protein FliM